MLVDEYVQCYGLAEYLPTDRHQWRDDEGLLAVAEKS
jgi:hypothetical protein